MFKLNITDKNGESHSAIFKTRLEATKWWAKTASIYGESHERTVSEPIDITEEEKLKSAKAKRKQAGKICRDACNSAIEILAGFNIQNEATTEQKDQMELDFTDVLGALNSLRPAKAIGLIMATVFDAAQKAEILEAMNEELAKLADL